MPRVKRPKTPVQLVAEALEALQIAEDSLAQIDLRRVTTRGDLRRTLSAARANTTAAKDAAMLALRSDGLPVADPAVRTARTA